MASLGRRLLASPPSIASPIASPIASASPGIAALSYYSTVALPTLTLYSKADNCSLCDDAKKVIFKYGDKFNYEEVDITSPGNEVWFDLYKYDIPVVHINNQEVMRHYVFDGPLLDALHNATQRMAKPDT